MLQAVHDNSRHYVTRPGNRIIAAVSPGHNTLYVHPVMTPSGLLVTQERPADHLHHLGIFVGHDRVNGHNFWWPGHYGCSDPRARHRGRRGARFLVQPRNSIRCVAMDFSPDGESMVCRAETEWETEAGELLLEETRVMRIGFDDQTHFVEVASELKPAQTKVTLGRTKEAGLAVRLALELEAKWGGRILDTEGRVSEAKIFDQDADAIAVHGCVGGRECGIAVIPHPSSERCPWFVREYGLQNHNPFRHRDVVLDKGESYKLRCLFAAFDGSMNCERLQAFARAYRKTS